MLQLIRILIKSLELKHFNLKQIVLRLFMSFIIFARRAFRTF